MKISPLVSQSIQLYNVGEPSYEGGNMPLQYALASLRDVCAAFLRFADSVFIQLDFGCRVSKGGWAKLSGVEQWNFTEKLLKTWLLFY